MDKKVVLTVIMGVFISIFLMRSQIAARHSAKHMSEKDAELSYFEDDQFAQESGQSSLFDLLSSLAVTDINDDQVDNGLVVPEEQPVLPQIDEVESMTPAGQKPPAAPQAEPSVAQVEPKVESQLPTLVTQNSQIEQVKPKAIPVAQAVTVPEPPMKPLLHAMAPATEMVMREGVPVAGASKVSAPSVAPATSDPLVGAATVSAPPVKSEAPAGLEASKATTVPTVPAKFKVAVQNPSEDVSDLEEIPQEYIEDLEEDMPQLPGDVPLLPEEAVKKVVGKPEKLGGIVDEVGHAVAQADFDEALKRKQVVELVERAANFFNQNSLANACKEFTHTKNFVKGELYVFVFDFNGTNLAHGQQSDLLWKNLYDLKDQFGAPIVKTIIDSAKNGGGWVTYSWRQASKNSYVQAVEKDGVSYVVGAGYYSHSKADAVVNLVDGAASLFEAMIKDGWRVEDAFGLLSYPKGRFIKGDLYLYALDFKGNHFAHGERPGLIGTNAINYTDSQGKFVNKEIIKALNESGNHGIWIDYISRKAHKKAYARKVTDAQGNEYFIACGYYPSVDRETVVDLVRRGYQFVKTSGKSIASREFSDLQNDDYRFGDLYLIMYDANGNILAHGDNKELIGKNYINEKDENGRSYVHDIITKANSGNGWINVKLNNSFKSIYVEKIDLGQEILVITSGMYPVSKKETVKILARSAASYLESNPEEIAFYDFVTLDGKFVRGDLGVFAIDVNGICYAYVDDYGLIWQNILNIKDDNGKMFVREFIEAVKAGAGEVTYVLNGDRKIAYVEPVTKGNVSYVVGSSFYL